MTFKTQEHADVYGLQIVLNVDSRVEKMQPMEEETSPRYAFCGVSQGMLFVE